jgi:hypothetical protein
MKNTSVSSKMLDAIDAQTELFDLIQKIVKESSKEILGRAVIIRPNYWGAWDYRSVLMTFDIDSDDKRAGFHPYGWFIYYNRPDKLVFAHKETPQADWQERDSLNLLDGYYFQLTDDEKTKLILSFIQRNLKLIQPEVED